MWCLTSRECLDVLAADNVIKIIIIIHTYTTARHLHPYTTANISNSTQQLDITTPTQQLDMTTPTQQLVISTPTQQLDMIIIIKPGKSWLLLLLARLINRQYVVFDE